MSLRATVLASVVAIWVLTFATLGFLTITRTQMLVLRTEGSPPVIHANVVHETVMDEAAFAAAFNRRFVIILISVAALTMIAALVLTDRSIVRLLYSLDARLKKSEERRKALTADVAHELRTPLTNLRGAIESLQDGVTTATPEELRALHDDVMLLDRLITDLHQLSLGDAGMLDLRCVPSDIAPVLRAAANGSTRIVLDVPTDLPHVRCDPARVRQLVGNIIGNALRYAPDGRIVVRARSEAANVTVSVEDRGPGFPPDQAEALFERLYRVDNSRTRETGGSGIGLAIAKQLVEAQGGRISAHINEYGGATLSFTLPRDVN